MSPHAYAAPYFPGRPTPRGCQHGERTDDGWSRCGLPEDDHTMSAVDQADDKPDEEAP